MFFLGVIVQNIILMLNDIVNSEAYNDALEYIQLITPQFGPLIEYGGICVDNTTKLSDYTTRTQIFIASYGMDPTLRSISLSELIPNEAEEDALTGIKKYVEKTIKAILKMHDSDGLVINNIELPSREIIESDLKSNLKLFRSGENINPDNVIEVLNDLLIIYKILCEVPTLK